MTYYPYVEDDESIVFSSRARAEISWPVRIAGMQGLWRYVGLVNNTKAEVIGPYFPSNPQRNGGRSRIVSIDLLKYAGKSAKPVDVISVETQALSNEAKRARRR